MANLSVREVKPSAVACELSCESIIEGAYLETLGLDENVGDHYRSAVEDASICLAGMSPSCIISQEKLIAAIRLRAATNQDLRDSMRYEKDGVPLYNAVNLAQMQEGLGLLYVKLINTCKYDTFISVANKLFTRHFYNSDNTCIMSLKDFDAAWSKFEKDPKFSDAQAHIRYLKGNDVYAAKLLIICGEPLSLIKQLFPVK